MGATKVLVLAFALALGMSHYAAGKSIRQRSREMQRSEFRPVISETLKTDLKSSSTVVTAAIVIGDDGVPQVLPGGNASENRVVWMQFDQAVEQTGWSHLEVHTNKSFPDEVQAEAAGFLEGYLTAELIWDAYRNVIEDYCQGDEESAFCARLMSYISSVLSWADLQIYEVAQEERAYWHQFRLIMTQLQGMINGFNILAPDLKAHALHLQDFLIMSLNGDLETLENVLKAPSRGGEKKVATSSCSAMVKILPDFKEIYFTHDTWDTYYRMLRIYKNYDLQFSLDGQDGSAVIPGARIGFSSYPMNLQSNDDFYTIGSGLAVMETTIGNNNQSLFGQVTFNTLPYYFRIQIANRLATSGEEWAKIFAMHNSGTYNNNWMVFDYKKFTRGRRPQAGAFTVLEQLPTFIHVEDLTEHLIANTYFASYNIAYFPETFKFGNFQALVDKYGDFFTYTGTPRAKIFARDHQKAESLDTVLALMRYNDFKHDEYGRCKCEPPYSGENAIAARSDLNPANGTYELPFLGHRLHGATDCKITSSSLMTKLSAHIISGPTRVQQPTFKWSTSGAPTRPLGHPDAWEFEPVTTSWVMQ